MPRNSVILSREPHLQMKLPMQHPVQQPIQHSIQHPTPHPVQHSMSQNINNPPSTATFSQSTASDIQSPPEPFNHQPSYLVNPVQDRADHVPFVKSEQVPVPHDVPHSVKGAPAHLRPAIRKRQNSESAKRSRQRRKEAAKIFYQKFDEQCERLSRLEEKVATLTEIVKREVELERRPDGRRKDEDRVEATPIKQDLQMQPNSDPNPPASCPHDAPHASDPPASVSPRQPHTSIIQAMATVASPYPDEVNQHVDASQIPFEDDLEALLETCIQSQHLFGASL